MYIYKISRLLDEFINLENLRYIKTKILYIKQGKKYFNTLISINYLLFSSYSKHHQFYFQH